MKENRKKFHNDIECVQNGFANGSALDRPLTDEEKQKMIEEATEHFGNFLTALKCDWQNDPNSADTPSISPSLFTGLKSISSSLITRLTNLDMSLSVILLTIFIIHLFLFWSKENWV